MSTTTQIDTKVLEKTFAELKSAQYTIARSTAKTRKAKLRKLHDSILRNRDAMCEALWNDFRKSPEEVDISEVICTNSEIRHAIKNLSHWMQHKPVPVRLPLFTTRSEIRYEPKGVCLIISPWNFPFNLSFIPLVSAVAAGNTVVIKPSEHTPHSSALIRKIVSECFDSDEVCVIEGGVEVSKALLELPFNHIFFTGGPTIGKSVMRAAAQHLASVTLELGGKSPVIVDRSADLDRAASRIMWYKNLNAGQVCLSCDYILVHEEIKEALVKKMQEKYQQYYGEDASSRAENPEMSHLVHERHFTHTQALLQDALEHGAKLEFGGTNDRDSRFFDLAVLSNVPQEARVMQEEIFAPILPIKTFREPEEVVDYVRAHPKPLAMYIFCTDKKRTNYYIRETRGGGVCVNDCMLHFFNPNLPFGGSNNSGIGYSHGHFGFLEFTNQRSVTIQNRWFGSTWFFLPPYKGRLFKLFIRVLSRWI